MNKKLVIFLTLLILVAVFFGASYLYNENKTMQANQLAKQKESNLIRNYSPYKGPKDAKVTIVEFFDPACEACRAFHPYVSKILEDYPDKVRVVMRYTPFHEGSDIAVSMLDAANMQGKFWETLEAMFSGQQLWASHHNPQPGKLWLVIQKVDLNLNKLKQDMQSMQVSKNVNQDAYDLKELGINRTPSFFVNGKPLIDLSPQQLREEVESKL